MAINHKDILEHFKSCGLTGQPVCNFLAFELQDNEPKEVLEALRLLEKNGYLKLVGPRTLNDLGALIEEKSAGLLTLEEQKTAQYKNHTNHETLFHGSTDGFFDTDARVTLSGRFALATGHLSLTKQPAPLPADAVQKLNSKRLAEKQKREGNRPRKIFDEVMMTVIRDDAKEWPYATKYWGAEEWALHKAHERLVASHAEYKKTLDSVRKAAAVLGKSLDKQEGQLTEGSLFSKVVENPFTRVGLGVVFTSVLHLPSARKLSGGLNALYAMHQADQAATEPKPGTSPATPKNPG